MADYTCRIGSIPDITETLNLRKTPRLPPKTQTPRHTNIGGSPLRHSSVKPASQRHSPVRPLSEQPADRANRKLDFSKDAEPIRATTEKSPSPAKQRKTRKSLFSFEGFDSPVKRVPRTRSDSEDLDKTVQEAQHVLDTMVDDAMDSMADGETYLQPIEEAAMSESELDRARSPSANPPSSNQKRKREHLPPNNETADESGGKENDQPEPEQKRRKSDADLTQAHAAPEPTIVEETFAETTENEPEITEHTIAEPDATEYTVAEPTNIDHTVYTTADPTEHTVADQTEYTVADPTEYTVAEPSLADETVPDDAVADQTMADDTTAGNQTTLEQSAPQSARRVKTLSVHRDQETAQGGVEEDDDVSSAEEFIPPPDTDHEQEPEPEPTVQPKKRGRGRQPKQSKPRKTPHPPVERDPNSQVRASRDTDSADSEGGTKKKGPKSIVSLRAGTPAEDEGATTTRSGRTSIKPLKYWCNESFLWKNGEVEGIVRASEVPDGPKQPSRRPGRSKKKAGLGAIREDEEEEDEDLLPEAWEEELGVINGRVRAWDADMGVGNPDDEVHEGMLLQPYWYTKRPLNHCDRHCLCIDLHRNTRRSGLCLPVCQSHDDALLRRRHG